MANSSNKAITHLDDLSNELIYEIFEYLDFHEIYQIFSNLNERYSNLVNNSLLPIKLNISSISKKTFEESYINYIHQYQHRISLMNITNLFIYDHIYSPIQNLFEFRRLTILTLENISLPVFRRLYESLLTLPKLSSLSLILIDYVEDKSDLYNQLFHLPNLNYCKISFKERKFSRPVQISQNVSSPIKHLIIDNDCYINDLYILLSYVPKLTRLVCNNLLLFYVTNPYVSHIVLKDLTHLSLKFKDIDFNSVELLLKNISHQLEVFYLSTNYNRTYLNANRWQALILSHMSKLRIFDIQLLSEYNSQYTILYDMSIEQFMNSFWFERKWFFRYEYQQQYAAFYSINPYRRNSFLFKNCFYQDTYPLDNTNDCYSIRHLSIQGNITTITETKTMYFPNITELTIFNYINKSLHSISSIFNQVLPLTQLTKVSFECQNIYISQLIELLYFSPNIKILILNSVSLSKINVNTIQETQTYKTIAKENRIQKLIFKQNATAEVIQLFIKLCSRVEQITIDLSQHFHGWEWLSALLSDNNHFHHVTFICFSNTNYRVMSGIQRCFSRRYSIKIIQNDIYVWL